MALHIPAGDGQATLIWTQTGDPDPYTVSFGFGNSTGLSANACAAAIRSRWVVDFSAAANLSNFYTFRGVETIINTGGVFHEGADLTVTPGSWATNPAAQNTALLVKKTTGLAGRANRGRTYLPPCYLDEAGIGPEGTIVSATLTTLNARLATFLAHLVTDNLEMLLLHNDVGLAPGLVTGYVMEPIVATQRRRLR